MCTGRVRHRTISGMRTYSMYVVRRSLQVVYIKFLYFIFLLQLFAMHLLGFLVLVWEERKAKA